MIFPRRSFFWLVAAVLALVGLLVLDFFGIIWHNNLFAHRYQVQGLDVSHHQGIIDWKKVAATQKYAFVYIKATEGHDFIDDAFIPNWQQARTQGLAVGAYHFFSTRSSGQEQADFFIANVPYEATALPPVIDIEIDAAKDPAKIRPEIKALSDQLETHYKKTPLLYVTYDTYEAYVKNYFPKNDIWIRDVFFQPHLRNWRLWQYGNRGRVKGIPAFVDVNVFNGSKADFLTFTK